MSGRPKLTSGALIMGSMLGAATLPSAVAAQAAAEWAEQDSACMALRALQIEEHLRLREEWVRGTFQAIDAGKQDECLELYDEAVQELEADETDGVVVLTDEGGPLAPLR